MIYLDQNNQQDITTQNLQAAQGASVNADGSQEYEIVNGVACPIDPQERLLCESCQ